MFNLFDAVDPAVLPKLNVLVVDIAADILDVPVNVKPVAVAISRTVAPAVVVVVTIDPVLPNAMERVLLLVDENTPVVSVRLFRSNVPRVNVVVSVEPNVRLFVRSWIPPPGASIVTGWVNVFPPELSVLVALLENV